jgi:hypothetical protein
MVGEAVCTGERNSFRIRTREHEGGGVHSNRHEFEKHRWTELGTSPKFDC